MDRNNAILVFKCLSDTSRINIISALRSGEAYGELLAQRLGLSASTLSFHMKKLEEAGLVTSRRDQYYTLYSIEPEILEKRKAKLLWSGKSKDGGAYLDIAKRWLHYRRRKLIICEIVI